MNKKIKVAYVVNSILLAGAETTVLQLASYLDKDHFAPIVYVLRDYGMERPSLASKFENAGVPVIFLQPGGKLGIPSALRKLRKHLKANRPDILHLHLPDAVIAGGFAALSVRIPFIIHEHQTHQFHSQKIRLAYRVLRLFSALTICYAASVEQEIAGDTCELSTPPSELDRPFYTIPNGIDMRGVDSARSHVDRQKKREELGVEKDDIIIICAARFAEWKGQKNLVDAFARITGAHPSAKLVFAGDGGLLPQVQQQTRELGISNKVIFLGARGDVYEILAVSDIFSLVFSYPPGMDAEAVGVAGIEAMGSGLPVVVGAYMGVERYVRDGVSGVVVQPYNPGALGEALARLTEDGPLRASLGAQARLVAQGLSWGSIIAIYERIYELIAQV